MKTTSYEISKKLAEVGLSEQLGFCDYYYNKYKQLKIIGQESYTDDEPEETMVDCFAYDLETILEALPKQIERGEGRSPTSSFIFTKAGMGYAQKPQFEFREFLVCYENESLADTAARLLILLHNKGLINFKKD